MEGLNTYALYIAAILGAALGVSTLLLSRMKEMKSRVKFYKFASKEIDEALISADRALKNGATPPLVRKTILVMLETLATPKMGKAFTTDYFSYLQKKPSAPGKSNPLSEAMDQLHVKNPKLAADAHRAIMGMMLALPIMHAEKISVLEVAGETATNPNSAFEKVSKAVSHFGVENRGSSNRNGLAAC